MTATDDYDLIIVGAGLVGTALAVRVAIDAGEQGLRIALVEGGGAPELFEGDDFDPRVVALTPASEQLLEEVGAWSAIRDQRVCPYRDMEVWDGEGTGRIHFSADDLHAEHLGHIVENSVVLRTLRQRAAELEGVTLLQPALVTDLITAESPGDTSQLILDTELALRAPLVVAADGAHSRLRELAGFRTREWAYDQHAIVTTVRTEASHDYTARQRFMRTGPLALLPLRRRSGNDWDSHYCSIVWSADDALADELMALDQDGFCGRLGRDFEYELGAITHAAERFAIPLRQRHARQYVQPGIALVGDAAHSIHPLAGQGVNLGLRDVVAFADELQRARSRGLGTGDYSLLRRYQRRRLGDNLAMMGVMESFKRLFGTSNPQLTWLRNTGMTKLDHLPPLKNAIVRRAMGL